jgi:endonuclease/exonuclease/phosphatase family metal-dependent hydrolase
MRRTRILVLALALVAAGILASPGSTAAARDADTIRLKVMTFNIREGGVHGQFSKVVEAITAAGADVVGLQEPFGRTRKLARALGWYAAPRLHTISRFPILQPAGSYGFWGWLLVAPGEVVTIANIHNPSYPYTVDMMRLGTATKAEILQIERHVRIRWMQPFLDSLAPQLAAGDPVFFTGDFNAPSWRDWTPRVVNALGWQPTTLRYRAPRLSIRWPTSIVMEKAGFRDSFREVHPDAVTTPGFTWTSGHPGISPWDVFDRIDFVWAAGSSQTLSSRVVGDDDPMSDVVVEPWPSDHRAVVSTFRVEPADAPTFVAPLDVRVPIGRPVHGAFHAAPDPTREVGIWARDANPATDDPIVSAVAGDGTSDGRFDLTTAGFTPGIYTLALIGSDGTLSRSAFAVVEPTAPATISVAQRRYAVGEPILVSWTNAPGNRYDWLDLTAADATPTTGRIWLWRYIDARIFGSAPFKAEATGNWPLPPGRYRVSLCVDDGFGCLASTDAFRVVG